MTAVVIDLAARRPLPQEKVPAQGGEPSPAMGTVVAFALRPKAPASRYNSAYTPRLAAMVTSVTQEVLTDILSELMPKLLLQMADEKTQAPTAAKARRRRAKSLPDGRA